LSQGNKTGFDAFKAGATIEDLDIFDPRDLVRRSIIRISCLSLVILKEAVVTIGAFYKYLNLSV
jgi:hypothetical protein